MWGPSHYNTVSTQLADKEDDLRIRRAAANILNKLSRTADKGSHSD